MLAGNRLKADRAELLDALDGDLTVEHRFVLHEVIAHIEEVELRIERFDQYLLEQLAPYRSTLALMQTIPGIDAIGAALLLVEIGDDMSAFGSVDRLASWAGICPGNNESAGKRKTGRIRKGNPWVRRLLCQFAHAASRTRCAFKSKFEALRLRRGHKRAIVAIAHKILKTVFLLISRQTHYRDSATDFEAMSVARNAPRWLKMLTKHGFIAAA